MRKIYLWKPTADKNAFYPVKVTGPEDLDNPTAIVGVLLEHSESLEAYTAQLKIVRITCDDNFGQPLLLLRRGQTNAEQFWNLIKDGSLELFRQFALKVVP